MKAQQPTDSMPEPRTPGRITGSCLCGGVRFEVTTIVGPFELCHCSRCRKATGAAFAPALGVATAGYRLLCGRELIATYEAPILESPPPYTRHFCRRCGCLVPEPEPKGEWFEIAAGLLDEDPGLRPDKHIYVDHAAPWYQGSDALPRLDAAAIKASRAGLTAPETELSVTAGASLQDVAYLEDRLYDFNVAATGIADGDTLAFLVRDHAGRIVAGVHGVTWGGCCEIRQLWVTAPQRGKGWGRRLLLEAEDEAQRRGCSQMVLSTHSFQAPEFYARHGYDVVARVEDYPRGHANIVMRKRLTEGPREPTVRKAPG